MRVSPSPKRLVIIVFFRLPVEWSPAEWQSQQDRLDLCGPLGTGTRMSQSEVCVLNDVPSETQSCREHNEGFMTDSGSGAGITDWACPLAGHWAG